MNIRTNLTLGIMNENELNHDHNLVITGLTYNNRLYTELELYGRLNNVSVPTIRRRIKSIPNRNCSQYFIRNNNKLYVSDAIRYFKSKEFSTIDDVKGNWVIYLSGFEWDYFGTVRFKNKFSIDTVRKKVETFFAKLSSKFRGKGIRLFYTLENALDENGGFHIHFILWVDHEAISDIKKFTENHFRGKSNSNYANTLLTKYDASLGGIAYILKEIHIHEDSTDFLVKNI